MKKANDEVISKEELLFNYESLLIKFIKEDDCGLDTKRTETQLNIIKNLILERMVD